MITSLQHFSQIALGMVKKSAHLFFRCVSLTHLQSHVPVLALVSLLSVSVLPVSAHETYSRVKIKTPSSLQMKGDLLGLLEIDHFIENNGYIYTEISEKALSHLNTLHYPHEVLVKDVAAELKAINMEYFSRIKEQVAGASQRVAFDQSGSVVDKIIRTPSAFVVQPTFGGYYRYGQMDTAMNNLVAAYPGLVQKFSIGNSYEGRPIYCVKISDNVASDESEPEILYMGLQHAREAISGSSMIFFMQYLCETYSLDSRIKDLVDNREFYIIPCMNPDGYEYNRSTNPDGGGAWRKNRSDNGDGTFGVDLNRNWSVSWANCGGAPAGCGSNLTSSALYWGTAAFSEPETQAVRNFALGRNFVACLDQHSPGPYYSIPPGRAWDSLSTADLQVYIQMTALMGKYNGMRYGNSLQSVGYEVAGGVKDWMYKGEIGVGSKQKVYGLTGEGGTGDNLTGAATFWPAASLIEGLCKGMCHQNLQFAYMAGSYVDIQDIGRLDPQTLTGSFGFRLRRVGLGNQPVTVTCIPISNITSVGAPVTIASLPNYGDTVTRYISYVLPAGTPNGQVLKYAWKVETGGYTYFDTVVNIYRGTVLANVNMDAGGWNTNWTSTGTWNFSTDYFYGASGRSIAESPNNTNYPHAINYTCLYKTNLNLSGAGSAYFSFWVRHRSENFHDKLQVQASTDGTTWVELQGLTTVQEPGIADGSTIDGKPALTGIQEFWKREVFDLKNFLGASALRLRFNFSSDPSDTYAFAADQGFNIDDFFVMTGGAPSLLPVELMNFSGKNADDVNHLNWATASEINSSHFVVERSSNGIEFEEIGTVSAAGNSKEIKSYHFIDQSPYNGENVYRLRMVDLDETFNYSKLVSLKVNDGKGEIPSGIANVYPNPANGQFTVNFLTKDASAVYQLRVYGITGQVVYNKQLTLTEGIHSLPIDITGVPAGEYILSVTHLEDRITYESKVVKF